VDFFAAVVEEKSLEGVFCFAGSSTDWRREQLGEDDAALAEKRKEFPM